MHGLQWGQPHPQLLLPKLLLLLLLLLLLVVQSRVVQGLLHRLRCAEVDLAGQRRRHAKAVEIGHACDAHCANSDAWRANGVWRVELHLARHLRGEANLVSVGQHGPHGATRATREVPHAAARFVPVGHVENVGENSCYAWSLNLNGHRRNVRTFLVKPVYLRQLARISLLSLSKYFRESFAKDARCWRVIVELCVKESQASRLILFT